VSSINTRYRTERRSGHRSFRTGGRRPRRRHALAPAAPRQPITAWIALIGNDLLPEPKRRRVILNSRFRLQVPECPAPEYLTKSDTFSDFRKTTNGLHQKSRHKKQHRRSQHKPGIPTPE